MFVKKKGLAVLTVLSLSLWGCGLVKPEQSELLPAPEVTGTFQFSVLKVGQADAMILQTENHCVLIDCGEEDDGSEVVEYLNSRNIAAVDYLLITHFDKDHVGGVPEVMDNVSIGEIVTPDYESTGDEYESYLQALEDSGTSPLLLTENKTFTLDDVLFEVFPPQRSSYVEDDNDFSLAVSVTHGSNTFLFTGDAEAVRLSEIMLQTNRNYDFLKVPHHGKYNSTTKKFVEKIKPDYAVITDSDKNPAEAKTVEALENAGCKVYHTKDGDITVISDGTDFTVTQ